MSNNTVLFYRKKGGEDYYYINKETRKLDNVQLELLKTKIKLPTKLEFCNIPYLKTKKIVKKLITTDMMKAEFKKITPNEYVAFLTKKEKNYKLYTFKITNKCQLEGRSCNPYKLLKIDNKQILLETDIELAKEQEGEYYLLWNDLTEYEQKFFGDEMKLIDIDYIYNYNQNMMNKIYSEKNNNNKILYKSKKKKKR